MTRTYTSRRYSIVAALVDKLKLINGTGTYRSDISGQVFSRLKFYTDVTNFPCICVTAGNEVRDYQAGGYKDRYLDVRILIYVNESDSLEKLEAILEDVETIVETNSRLTYYDRDNNTQATHDITVLSLSTDEGALDPISIGEMTIRVHY